MNTNHTHIQALRKIIYETLDPLITQDYCLLDTPNYKNIGDNLIWAGELAFLKRLSFNMVYTANMYLCNFSKIPIESTILLQGGGNFGDLWRTSQEFRNKVVANCKNNKIIIFPQTVFYNDKTLLKKDAQLFAQHPHLTICARDHISYAILKQHFSHNNILLLPDMAFCLSLDKNLSEQETGKALLMKRVDKELNTDIDIKNILSSNLNNTGRKIHIKDWPTYNLGKQAARIDAISDTIQRKISERMIGMPVAGKLVDYRYGLKRRDNLHRYIKMGIRFINEYDEIYTTRLHGYILSILLNKKVHIIDNSYGKNSSFFNTWMKNFENSFLITA